MGFEKKKRLRHSIQIIGVSFDSQGGVTSGRITATATTALTGCLKQSADATSQHPGLLTASLSAAAATHTRCLHEKAKMTHSFNAFLQCNSHLFLDMKNVS